MCIYDDLYTYAGESIWTFVKTFRQYYILCVLYEPFNLWSIFVNNFVTKRLHTAKHYKTFTRHFHF